MRFVLWPLLLLLCCPAPAQVLEPAPMPLPEPRDHPFHRQLELSVDATDTDRGIVRVNETVPVQQPGDMVLLYPEWETTSHAPTASAVELAGLRIHADATPIEWRRDTLDVHAFHLTVPADARALQVSFDDLADRSSAELLPHMVDLQWSRLLLYPAGWYARNILVKAQLRLHPQLLPYNALAVRSSANSLVTFEPVTLDRLVDAPVYGARDSRQVRLTAPPDTPAELDLVADDPADLAISPAQIASLRALVRQTSLVFGAPPFRHYHALISLSDTLSPGGGLEHLEEGGRPPARQLLLRPRPAAQQPGPHRA